MNTYSPRHIHKPLFALALTAHLLLSNTASLAAPGAHGPNGEHLDGPSTMRAASALPRLEAKSETFELVAELRTSELVILIDRYDSNEPVLGAQLEVENGPLKATAAFRAEQGDYVVTDVTMLKALAAPGEHGLVFTLVAGKDSDLLDGTLTGTAGRNATVATKDGHGHTHAGDDHAHDHELERAAWIGAGVVTLGLMGGIGWWRQRHRSAGLPQGGL